MDRDPGGGANNDAFSPSPGFTEKQLDRLALLYVAASVRRGQWLLPAFHAAIDAGIPNAHDDPQNFDLDGWLASLERLLAELRDDAGIVAVTSPLTCGLPPHSAESLWLSVRGLFLFLRLSLRKIDQ